MEKFFILKRPVDLNFCKTICSDVNYNHFELYIKHLRNKKLHKAIQILYDISSLGYSVVDIYDYFFSFIKETQLLLEHEKYTIIPLFCDYITIFHSVHEDPIELALFTNRVFIMMNNNKLI